MNVKKMLGWKNGHDKPRPIEKREVQQRLNEVERKITGAHIAEVNPRH